MGREYCGDIEGKFWFSIQSSNDADYFGGNYTHPYRFYGCGCTVENVDEKLENYCKDCFSSFDEHYENCGIDEEIDLIYQDKNLCQYQFTNETILNAKKVLRELENEYGNLIIDYNIEDDNKSIRYTVDYINCVQNIYNDEDKFRKLENIARICLGRQIVYCLEKQGSCYFTAEV